MKEEKRKEEKRKETKMKEAKMSKISIKLHKQNSIFALKESIEIEMNGGSEEERRKVLEMVKMAVMGGWVEQIVSDGEPINPGELARQARLVEQAEDEKQEEGTLESSDRGNEQVKATGIVRKIDELGRIVIPKEIRRTISIEDQDPMEMFLGSDGEIILKRYQPGCIFCAEIVDKPIEIKGRKVRICGECMRLIKQAEDEKQEEGTLESSDREY